VATVPIFIIHQGGHPNYDPQLKKPFPGQKGGYFELPKAPALGIELDEAALVKYASHGIVPMGYNTRFAFASRQQSKWI
ncbi:MAG: hypothetical protein Q8O40_00955, partial [Chloroflexota bacterium]|nr:hypothetical protein [Chloroflexota bacterium]